MKLHDGLRSLISNLGNPLKDKAAATVYGYARLTDDQLIAAYATSWAARKLINVPAGDMLRHPAQSSIHQSAELRLSVLQPPSC